MCFRFTCMQGFVAMMKELQDLAGQHDYIAEALTKSVLKELQTTIQDMKQERKRVNEKPYSVYQCLARVLGRRLIGYYCYYYCYFCCLCYHYCHHHHYYSLIFKPDRGYMFCVLLAYVHVSKTTLYMFRDISCIRWWILAELLSLVHLVVVVVVMTNPSGNCLYEGIKMSRRDEEFHQTESGGIRLSFAIVDSHLLTGAPLKGGCHCPQLTYCQPLSNDQC